MSYEEFDFPACEPERKALPIQPRCANCPALAKASRVYDLIQDHLVVAQLMGESTMADIPEELSHSIADLINTHARPEDRERYLRDADSAIKLAEESARKDAASHINFLEDSLESMEAGVQNMQADCSGPLTLRALKNEIEYRATICASLMANPGSNEARVTRREV